MWRGTEIPEAWKEHNTYEYFTFTKLDENDPAVQKLTAEYWLGLKETDIVEGRMAFDAKMYKWSDWWNKDLILFIYQVNFFKIYIIKTNGIAILKIWRLYIKQKVNFRGW